MFKKFYIALILALVSLTATAYDFEVDGIYYKTISAQDLTCEVTFKDRVNASYTGDVVIPSTVTYGGKTLSVISIGEAAFALSDGLTTIQIPNTVTSIGSHAFAGCSSLSSIEIPNSVTSIGQVAFLECYNLTSVKLPISITSIAPETFNLCTSLISIELPNTITSIGDGAFNYCSGLTSMTIPNSVTSIGEFAFFLCSNLTSVTIGNSVTSIGTQAFYNCSALKVITSLPINPPIIYGNTFEGIPKTDVILKVPDESVVSYQTANYWKAFWNIVGLNEGGGDPIKCAEPTIELENGKLVVKSATEGSECYTSITSEDFKNVNGNEPISLTGIYNITTYAHAEGYLDSETVSAILVWVNPELQSDGIISMEAKKSILLRTNDDAIIISGLEYGEWITLYNITGRLLESVKATGQELKISNGLQKGQIYIVKVGDKNVKIKL